MIKVVVFDLDGTLIQTEVLKARSYARAIHGLTGRLVPERRIMDRFAHYVGLSRAEVVQGLVETFHVELQDCFPDVSQKDLQDMVITRRLEIYDRMITDPKLMSKFFCPYSRGLLQSVHRDQFQTALATMSNRQEVDKVLNIMDIRDQLNVVFTRNDVSKGKPDPEIYLAVKDYFKVQPEECLVIEDSVNGIKAAINAGIPVFAVTNNVTRASVHAANLLPEEFVVDDLTQLEARVYGFMKGEDSSI